MILPLLSREQQERGCEVSGRSHEQYTPNGSGAFILILRENPNCIRPVRLVLVVDAT